MKRSIGAPQPLILFGTDEQKEKYLPRCAMGEISAFALTESDVGSDPARMSTTATTIDGLRHASDTAVIAQALWLPYWFWGAAIALLSFAVLACGLWAATRPHPP